MKPTKSSRSTNSAGLKSAVTASAAAGIALFPAAEEVTAQSSSSGIHPLHALVAQLAGSEFTEAECLDMYFDRGYDYSDALVLASYWDSEPYDAKVRLGEKMLSFGVGDGRLHMRIARALALAKPNDELPFTCYDAGYEYEDATALAEYWGMEVWDTKVAMTRLLMAGNEEDLDASLSEVGR
ncbi:MAG: hypothetical protein AAF191_05385 [Verrucomicrobiota bacterium]